MNRKQAKEIAEKITNGQLHQMFISARNGIKNWEKVSRVNKGMTKGVAWNILAKDFDITKDYHILAKINMVREFGEFLNEEFKPIPRAKAISIKPIHQQPQF